MRRRIPNAVPEIPKVIDPDDFDESRHAVIVGFCLHHIARPDLRVETPAPLPIAEYPCLLCISTQFQTDSQKEHQILTDSRELLLLGRYLVTHLGKQADRDWLGTK